jgi:hypothetical protein
MESLGIDSYGVSITTLEEVFLKTLKDEKIKLDAENLKNNI